MKKYLFIDRDGTLIQEPPEDFQVDRLEKLEFMPGVISALRQIAETTDYSLVMVSNQDGLGTPSFPLDDFLLPQEWMLKTFRGEGVVFDEILIDPSLPEEHSPFRKPGIGMVQKYLNEYLDRENSYVIGDRITDMQLASNMGIKGILFGKEDMESPEITLRTDDWKKIATFLTKGSRLAEIVRKTAETEIGIRVDLNGEGAAHIETGIAFLDHMLEQIARHGGIDLDIQVKGDLQVDEHHTIEDTGIVLGECFARALGSRKGIERYGFALPMDESEAQVLLDLGGRSCLIWNAGFAREYVGDFPTEMTKHFFDSFCQSCKCNLQVTAKGENTHHKIEAIFKAFARTLREAVRQTGGGIPSSKGTIG